MLSVLSLFRILKYCLTYHHSRLVDETTKQQPVHLEFVSQSDQTAEEATRELPHGEADGAVPGAERAGRGQLLPHGGAAAAGGRPPPRGRARQRAAHASNARSDVLQHLLRKAGLCRLLLQNSSSCLRTAVLWCPAVVHGVHSRPTHLTQQERLFHPAKPPLEPRSPGIRY